ncbi:MAG: hypothetical protein ACJ77D_05545 [Chloroflexota bacterium]
MAEPVAPRRQPGSPQVAFVAASVVIVVVGAALVTGFLPEEFQRAIFHGPVLIGVLIVGTAWVLWRISRGRPMIDERPTDNDG